MTEIQISRIEKRLRKIEDNVVDIKDHYEEMDNNLEDIYETINNLKSLDTKSDTDSDTESHSSHQSSSKTHNDKQNEKPNEQHILKMIKQITNTNTNTNTLDQSIIKKILLFHNKLVESQKQLSEQAIYEHIKYFIEQSENQKDTILDNINIISNLSDVKIPRLFKILNSSLDAYHKKLALHKLQLLETMQKTDSEYFKLSQWLDIFLQIPFNIYKTPAYQIDIPLEIQDTPDTQDTPNTTGTYLLNSRKHLDTIIYGQEHTKQHIIEILARMIRNPKTTGSVFAIYGEAGTGKTTLIKEGLSHIFGLPFIFISLGGAQDRTTLSGSNYVYEGSSCGKIIQSLNQSRCMNPIFYFDELDKVSETDKGNEIINLLVHLTDYTQNGHFMDDYMDGIAIDLSRATFVFSFNNKDKISPILLDRMEIIKFKSYSVEEKMIIARQYLIPNVVYNVFNDKNIKVILSDKNLRKIVAYNDNTKYKNIIHKLKSRIKLGKIMKNCSRYKKQYIGNYNGYGNRYLNGNMYGNMYGTVNRGGVRYIKKLLERIISRINVDMMMNTSMIVKKNANNNGKKNDNNGNKDGNKKKRNSNSNEIIINDNIVDEIINKY